ncbi:hypothetical protein [Mesohalobacter halotolerans]|uniref:Uncharacterized protein n=1 Tax=Mesohalobacter halotolerans TaxID=1883405 RepID=A0A4U5TSU9_9FLAO|nr:hypothetical protein [Mesohalobacter halotolerans]TKS57409.1 hypothetical protein FCN74_03025 [Mesohalobacter halotolerans]
MRLSLIDKRILSSFYKNKKWRLENDLIKDGLNGKVKSISEHVTLINKPNKMPPESWADANTNDYGYDKMYNHLGYLMQETKYINNEKIDYIKSLEYIKRDGFCNKEIYRNHDNKILFTNNFKYLYSNNKITKWLSEPQNNLITKEFYFLNNKICRIDSYARVESRNHKDFMKQTLFDKNQNKKMSRQKDSFGYIYYTYKYKDNKLNVVEYAREFERIPEHNRINRKYYKYDKSGYLTTINWCQNNEITRTDNFINDDKGNWITKDIYIYNTLNIRVKRRIEYYRDEFED